MRLLGNQTLLRIFCILIFLNTLVLCGSQYYVYTKHWDMYWFSSFFYRELLLCVSYFFVFFLFSLLPARLGKICAYCVLTISIICFIIDAFLLYTFDTNLNSYLVIVALETNPQESAEFLHNYFTLGLCAVYACIIVVCAILWRIVRPIKPTRSKILGIWISFITGIIVLIAMILTQTKPLNEDWSDMLYNYTKQIYRALHSTYAFIEEYKHLNAAFDTLASKFQVRPARNSIDNIVLVIGESTQRQRLSLYGYHLPTTPILQNLRNKEPEHFIVFSDVIAPHAQTHESLSLSLTLANQDSQGISTFISHSNTSKKQAKLQISKTHIKPWYEYLNIIDAFKLGGYETFSISNQEPVSLFGNAAASILKRADSVEFVNINDKMSTTKFDESILEILDRHLKAREQINEGNENSENAYRINKSKGHFYTLHLMGNHAKYYNRYPLSFAHFSEEDMLCLPQNGDFVSPTSVLENMHYDNSVLYGDYVLNAIIERFANSDSIVIFFSDHGEEIYDFRDFIGHSDSKISRFLVEIPFMIYMSESFKNKHPKLYARIKNAANQRYMNDDLMHTLLDIAGIELKGYEPQRSLFSVNKTFLNKRMRKVGDISHIKDYDKELRATQSYVEQGLCSGVIESAHIESMQ